MWAGLSQMGGLRETGVSTGHTCCSRGCRGGLLAPPRPLTVLWWFISPSRQVGGGGYWFCSGGGGNGLSECIITAKKEWRDCMRSLFMSKDFQMVERGFAHFFVLYMRELLFFYSKSFNTRSCPHFLVWEWLLNFVFSMIYTHTTQKVHYCIIAEKYQYLWE